MIARWWSAPVVALVLLAGPELVAAQQDAEQVIIAAGQWAAERLPQGDVRLDPHRTGQGTDPALADRVARAMGARLGTLEEMRRCSNTLDPSTCELGCDVLIAVASPTLSGDQARVRVYAWHRQDRVRDPIAQASWELRLQRTGDGWRVADARPRQ